jgi:hypothetical protein
VLWPVVFVFTDIINEYFGRPGVRKMSFLAAAIIAYSFVALTAAGAVPAASFSPVDDASFSRVFTQSQWIIVGSILAFLLAQLLDVTVFWMIRRATGHRFLWLRATGSTVFSQLIDTFVVGFIGLHLPTYFGRPGPNFAEFINAGFSGYLFKFAIALSVTPLLYGIHKIVDSYLGKTEAELLIEATAETERADDAHVLKP